MILKKMPKFGQKKKEKEKQGNKNSQISIHASHR